MLLVTSRFVRVILARRAEPILDPGGRLGMIAVRIKLCANTSTHARRHRTRTHDVCYILSTHAPSEPSRVI